MSDKVDHWLSMCDYDMDTAKAMFKSKRYLYVGFFCHLIVEKALKAMIASVTDKAPPRIHDLSKLADRSGLLNDLSDIQKEWIENLTPLNIEGRYTEYKEAIRKTLSSENCKVLIAETEAFLCMIKQKLDK